MDRLERMDRRKQIDREIKDKHWCGIGMKVSYDAVLSDCSCLIWQHVAAGHKFVFVCEDKSA